MFGNGARDACALWRPMPTVLIPTPFRFCAAGANQETCDGRTVGEALRTLTNRHSALRPHFYGENEQLRSFLSIYLNGENIRYLKGEETQVAPEDVLTIVPAIAGGSADGC
jgi:molybdopterin synthase sulfur carrier subunit